MAKRLKLSFSIDQILGLSKSSGEARNHHGDAASQVMAMISSAGSLGATEEHTAEYRLHSSPGSDGLNDYHSDEELKNRKRKRTRTTFSSAQVYELEKKFQRSQYLSAVDRLNLAAALSMSDVQVKRWFQNRRCKERHRAEEKTHGIRSPLMLYQQYLGTTADTILQTHLRNLVQLQLSSAAWPSTLASPTPTVPSQLSSSS